MPSLTASAVRRPFAALTHHAVLPSVLACAFLLAACKEPGAQPGNAAPGGAATVQAGTALGDAATGKRLMAQYQCGACHAIPGVQGAGGGAGPSLEHMGSLSYIAGRIPNNGGNMVAWLRDPPALKPGTPMPALGLSEQEARHMAAYLRTLK
ncbi:c-type cytochrome [Massilia forsythiae]|nr:c-type cytochrome [Massilia forsythiae]